MAKSSGFGAWSAKSAWPKANKPDELPAVRNAAYEALLCKAIAGKCRVEVRYRDDTGVRVLEPNAVYYSEVNATKIMLACYQISNDNDRTEQPRPGKLEIGRFKHVSILEQKFIPDPKFNRTDPMFKNGIICSV